MNQSKLIMERIKDRQSRSWEGVFYATRRMDLLVVSISGAGIYVCLETIKYLKDNQLESASLVKLSGVILLIAIVVNFASQILGRKSNYHDYLMCDYQLDDYEEPSEENKIKIREHDKSSDCYSKITGFLNSSSAILMLSGLLLMIIYYFTMF